MIVHQQRERPPTWQVQRRALKHTWMVPFVAVEWIFDWLAYALSRWSFLEVLEYLGSFSILIGVIFYFSESGDRLKQKHYQAWQVINTAQGVGGSGGRIDALQELDEDGVPLVGVDVSGAFLQGISLPNAHLLRSNFSGVDARNGDFQDADFSVANLNSGNFRHSNFKDANLQDADLANTDLCGANLSGVDFSRATLDAADMGNTDLNNAKWQKIKSLKGANIRGVKNAPTGFVDWALKNGAVTTPTESDCR
jgi:hypothetical protein